MTHIGRAVSQSSYPATSLRRWSEYVAGSTREAIIPGRVMTIGVLPGEGVGPEVIAAALSVLRAVESGCSTRCEVVEGGNTGAGSNRENGQVLSRAVIDFCEGAC